EVSRVEAEDRLTLDRVPKVELVRADDVALRPEAEKLAFDRVAVQGRVDRLGEQLVERPGQPLSRGLAVDRHVLEPVRDPDVGHARLAERLAEEGANPPAGDA